MANKEKPENIRLNLMKGNRDLLKEVNAKLSKGIISYNGMNAEEPIVYLGQPQYSVFDVRKKKLVLYYDTLRGRLLKMSELGGGAQVDAIADLSKNVYMSTKLAAENLKIKPDGDGTGKWMAAMLFIFAIFILLFMYMTATHGVSIGTSPAQATTTITQGLIHINTT